MPRVSLQDWPRLTRFYGISPLDLARMPNVLLDIYAEQLFVLHAEEALLGFTTSDMPYAPKSDRQRIYRAYERYLDTREPEKLDVRTEDGAKVAATLGIAVHIGDSEVESSVETANA